MPDLQDLDDFDQGLTTMNPLPPSEIRRRGDRLRRRRTALVATGGVLAAALAIGAPVIALSGADGGTDRGLVADPPTSPSPTVPPGGWRLTVPDDFPLTDGFGDPTAPAGAVLEGDPAVPAGCGTAFEGYVDDLTATYQGESEDRGVRILAVFPDATAAQTWLDGVVDTVRSCPDAPIAEGTTMVHDVSSIDFSDAGSSGGPTRSEVLVEQVQHDDGLLSELSTSVVWRVGNAVYLDYSFTAAGGQDVLDAEVTRLARTSSGPVAALCAFSVEGCAD